MRYEPNAISPNVIGGSPANGVTAGVRGATIAGGGVPPGNTDPDFANENPNRVTDAYGTIGGGYANRAGDNSGTTTDRPFATVGGGFANLATAEASTVGGGSGNSATFIGSSVGGGLANTAFGESSVVGGGLGNIANGAWNTIGGGRQNGTNFHDATVAGGSANSASNEGSTVSGGNSNTASGFLSTVGGGSSNTASGNSSTVPGGYNNVASEGGSFAAGVNAQADAQGCFVWNDGSAGPVTCGGPSGANRVVMRGTGGFIFLTSTDNSKGVELDDGRDRVVDVFGPPAQATRTSNRSPGGAGEAGGDADHDLEPQQPGPVDPPHGTDGTGLPRGLRTGRKLDDDQHCRCARRGARGDTGSLR